MLHIPVQTCRGLQSNVGIAGWCGWGGGGGRCSRSRFRALLGGFLLLHPGELVGQGTAAGRRDRALLRLRSPELQAIGGALLASWSRLAACARAQAGYGVLERRRNYCRVLDWWSLKWLQDSGERRQALSEGRLAVYEPNLPLKFKIHSFSWSQSGRRYQTAKRNKNERLFAPRYGVFAGFNNCVYWWYY